VYLGLPTVVYFRAPLVWSGLKTDFWSAFWSGRILVWSGVVWSVVWSRLAGLAASLRSGMVWSGLLSSSLVSPCPSGSPHACGLPCCRFPAPLNRNHFSIAGILAAWHCTSPYACGLPCCCAMRHVLPAGFEILRIATMSAFAERCR